MRRTLVHFFVILSCIFSFFPANAQEVELVGRVTLFNGKYRYGKLVPIQNVFIRCDQSIPTFSDENGFFKLTVVGKGKNENVELEVFKEGFKTVNDLELKNTLLGRQDTIMVFLANPEELDSFKVDLAGISLDFLHKSFGQKIDSLNSSNQAAEKVIRELSRRLSIEINSKKQAEIIIDQELDRISSQLLGLIEVISRVNLDFASSLYIESIELIKNGKIEEALRFLESANLEKKAERSIQKIEFSHGKLEDLEIALEKNRERLSQLINSLVLKSSLYFLAFELEKAKTLSKKILPFSKALNGSGSIEVGQRFDDLALFYYNLGKFDSAQTYLDSAIEIYHKKLPLQSVPIGKAYHDKSAIYAESGQPNLSLKWGKESFLIKKEVLGPGHFELTKSLNQIAIAFDQLGALDSAKIYFENCINSLSEQDRLSAVDKGILYSNLGTVLEKQGDLDRATEAYNKGITFLLTDSSGYNGIVALATTYDAIGGLYKTQAKFEEGIPFLFKSMKIRRRVYGEGHPLVTESLNNIGVFYSAWGNLDSAQLWLTKAIENEKQKTWGSNRKIYMSSLNLAMTLSQFGRHKEAQRIARESLDSLEKSNALSAYQFGEPYFILGTIFNYGKDFKTAEMCFLKGIRLYIDSGNTKNIKLIGAYSNLSYSQAHLGKKDKAISSLKSSIAIVDSSGGLNPFLAIRPRINLAIQLFNSGESQECRAVLNEIKNRLPSDLEELPEKEDFLPGLSFLYEHLGEEELAIEYRKELRPFYTNRSRYSIRDSIKNEFKIAQLTLKSSETQAAIRMQKNLVHLADSIFPFLDSTKAEVWAALAVFYRRSSIMDSAKYCQHMAVRFSGKECNWPNHYGLRYYNLATYCAELKELDSAVYYAMLSHLEYQKFLPRNHPTVFEAKTHYVQFLLARSHSHLDAGYDSLALIDIQTAINFYPNWGRAWYFLSDYHYRHSDYDQAIQVTIYANDLGYLNDSAFHNNMALYLIKNRSLKKAKRYIKLQEVSFSQPAYPLKSWALYYSAKRKYRKAENYLLKAIDHGYKGWDFISSEELFEPLRGNQLIQIHLHKN